jgi:hypothetical protein
VQTHHYQYEAARQAFLQLAVDARLETHVHPLKGPEGEVAMDIAVWGNPAASKVLVLSSGTHGVEGYCGSFIQCQLLVDQWHKKLPDDFMLVMIHGVNPYGFAWQRRVNEDNIDLNRNFIFHSGGIDKPPVSPPVNEGYPEMASALEPTEWNETSIAAVWQGVGAANLRHELEPGWQQAAMSGGQYAYPNGLFYGGTASSWSNIQLRAFAEKNLRGKSVVWLDIHTGLGRSGEAECIVEYPLDSKRLSLALKLWGDRVKNTKTAESLSPDVAGSIFFGMHQEIDDLVIAGLEYGTIPSKQVLEALIADQWLHTHGDLLSPEGQTIKQNMMDAFYTDDPVWRDAVYDIAQDLVARSLKL